MKAAALIISLGLWLYVTHSIFAKELIVAYKPGQSPDDILTINQKRKETIQGSPIIRTRYLLEDVVVRISQSLSSEEKMRRLSQIESQIGVVSKHRLHLADDQIETIYIGKLDDTVSSAHAMTLYETLPEVEFAEENTYNEVNY